MAYIIDLSNQAALVTGGAQGIGLAICKTLAAAGAKVALCDILDEHDARIQQALTEIAQAGAEEVLYIRRDLSIRQACYEVIDVVIEHFGKLDILVPNAAIPGKDNWDLAFAVNVKSIHYCYEQAKPYLERTGGRIVIVSTGSVLSGGMNIEYIGTKGGAHAMTRFIARECAPLGIRVNAVAPAVILSELMLKRFGSEEALLEHYKGKLPLGRMGTVTDIANAVLYLASDMSNWTCGETLLIDGGRLYLRD
ncbi:MAG: SDR family oxidoreductase [Oscillospiraceae bacterium]|nr:SDR family oxidoreductase [Oscillospiraceae bacterium]